MSITGLLVLLCFIGSAIGSGLDYGRRMRHAALLKEMEAEAERERLRALIREEMANER